MLRNVRANTPQGSAMTFTLGDPSNGYLVKSIDGLGPAKADIVSSAFARLPGYQFQSARYDARNIVMTLGFKPGPSGSVTLLRQELYRFFMTKMWVTLTFTDDQKQVSIEGMVETCEPVLFAKDPQVQISILCFDPLFKASFPDQVNGTTDGSPLVIDYQGNVEAGVLFRLLPDRTTPTLTLSNTAAGTTSQLNFASAHLTNNDVLEINTVPGNKRVTRIRSGVSTSMLNGVAPQSIWMQLYPGTNSISAITGGASMPYQVRYTKRYGGL